MSLSLFPKREEAALQKAGRERGDAFTGKLASFSSHPCPHPPTQPSVRPPAPSPQPAASACATPVPRGAHMPRGRHGLGPGGPGVKWGAATYHGVGLGTLTRVLVCSLVQRRQLYLRRGDAQGLRQSLSRPLCPRPSAPGNLSTEGGLWTVEPLSPFWKPEPREQPKVTQGPTGS